MKKTLFSRNQEQTCQEGGDFGRFKSENVEEPKVNMLV